MTIRFLTDEPALLITDKTYGKILAIADIHLGIESELYNNGIVIAPQSKKLFDKIASLIRLTKADKLVIIGDLKHKIPGISFRELKEIPKFMKPLAEMIDVILVKGNHDTELHGLFPNIGGVPLNRKKKKKSYIGSLLRSGALKVGKSEAYMLDGTMLGKVNKIK